MVVVDTSVWVAYLRDRRHAVTGPLEALLDDDQVALAAPVRVELLAGASRKDLPPLRRVLSALPLFFPSRDTWALAEQWASNGASRGEHFAVADLLIAATAAERGALVWSLDDDFGRLAKLKFVRLFRA